MIFLAIHIICNGDFGHNRKSEIIRITSAVRNSVNLMTLMKSTSEQLTLHFINLLIEQNGH